ncbi:MAG: hypothetical protein CVU52_06330 [Deltaproteobacteria bacterium HGW-Deltaproteobacteria-10]|nr:MAG: hypothetical protein CVU52_06330 [Deltaproteobacteria bacterium HGW-Deltaproteobacteria-10]
MVIKKPLQVEINPARRVLKMPGTLCGGIMTGTDKIRNGYGNGDCLYFDFGYRVFAVADGSERFPWASRDLLNRLSDSLARSGVPETVGGWKNLLNTEIYSVQKYQHKTTFSCVAISSQHDAVSLIISHGGDSVVAVMNSVTGLICHQTGRNMNFAGRSKDITDVTEYVLTDRDCRVLIATDGFNDFWQYCMRRSLFGGKRDVFSRYPVEGICEMIQEILEANRGEFEYDDIGLIIIDPFRAENVDANTVMLGGTTQYEEKKFLAEYSSEAHDYWLSEDKWIDHAEELSGAGIRIIVRQK